MEELSQQPKREKEFNIPNSVYAVAIGMLVELLDRSPLIPGAFGVEGKLIMAIMFSLTINYFQEVSKLDAAKTTGQSTEGIGPKEVSKRIIRDIAFFTLSAFVSNQVANNAPEMIQLVQDTIISNSEFEMALQIAETTVKAIPSIMLDAAEIAARATAAVLQVLWKPAAAAGALYGVYRNRDRVVEPVKEHVLQPAQVHGRKMLKSTIHRAMGVGQQVNKYTLKPMRKVIAAALSALAKTSGGIASLANNASQFADYTASRVRPKDK